MKSTIIFVLLFTATYAQQQQQQHQEETAAAVQERPARAPQGHIQYSDPDGLKVSWKLYAPYTQWKSHLENPQRNQRAESGTSQPAASLGPHQQSEFVKPAPLAAQEPAPITEEKPVQPVQPVQPVHQVQVQYKPYSMVPTHIKQLILEMYEPQIPYVDPAVYIYRTHQQPQEEEPQEPAQDKSQAEPQEETAQTSSQPRLGSYSAQYEQVPKYATKYPINKSKLGYIQYKDEQPTAAASQVPQYGAIPERREAVAEEPQPQEPQYQQQRREAVDDGMPKEIHQLLNLQAMTPYHVIANRILYKPKSIFVPKPLSDEVKGPYKYRSKVYFVKNDQETEEKAVKERTERDEPVEDRVEREEPKEEVSEE